MRVAIVGSRNWREGERIADYINRLPADTVIISGGARGADSMAAKIARYRGLEVVEYLPDWNANGKAAGVMRNTTIVENADAVVAFWDGKSKGTIDTVNKALAAAHIRQVIVIKSTFA